jgi:hypothetical protein
MNSDGQGALVRTWDIEQVYGPRAAFLNLYLSFISSFYMFALILIMQLGLWCLELSLIPWVGVNR